MVSQQRGEREVSQRVEVPLEEEDIVMAVAQQRRQAWGNSSSRARST